MYEDLKDPGINTEQLYEPRTVWKLTARADFPLPRNPGNGQKRWRAKEVLAWVETFRAKEAKI